MLGRIAISVTALLTVYFMLPLQDRDNLGLRAVAVVAGLTIFGAIFVRQLRQIRKARYPVLRAVEAIAMVATLFIVVMASIHYNLAAATPSSYSEVLSRLDALYFTVTTLATVGYGDITPTSDVTRSVTMVQMVMGIALLGAGIRILLGMARMVAEARHRDTATTPGKGS
jgi:voltage-gated potassium channel